MSDGSTTFRFNNQVTRQNTGSLEIQKTLTQYTPARALTQFVIEVALDGTPLPVGTAYTVDGEPHQVETAGQIPLVPGQTARIENVIAGSTFTVRELAASAAGYVVRYLCDGQAQSGDCASGVIGIKTAVVVTVENTEAGVDVSIPVQKTLAEPDGQKHTYKICLTQIDGPETQQPVTPAFTRELTLEIEAAPWNGAFTVGYPVQEITQTAQCFYYQISEVFDADDVLTAYDDTVWIVEVSAVLQDGTPQAAITRLWKNGELQDGGTIQFTNRLIHYELPETGGRGTVWYTAAGILLLAVVAWLYSRKRRKRGEYTAS